MANENENNSFLDKEGLIQLVNKFKNYVNSYVNTNKKKYRMGTILLYNSNNNNQGCEYTIDNEEIYLISVCVSAYSGSAQQFVTIDLTQTITGQDKDFCIYDETQYSTLTFSRNGNNISFSLSSPSGGKSQGAILGVYYLASQ